MNKIRLNDGAEYPVVYCGEGENIVCAQLTNGMTVQAAAEAFSNVGATERIEYLIPSPLAGQADMTAAVYAGYTRLLGVLRDRYSGRILVQLEKEG